MRTAVLIVCGCLTWAACLAVARLGFGAGAAGLRSTTIVFIAVWFAAAAVNLGVGVIRAGYSFADEAPIFMLIFALPALLAVFVQWKWFGVLTRG